MKVKIRTAKYSFQGYPIKYEDLEIDCDGAGTEDNPAVVDSFSDPKLNVEVVESDIFIKFKDCTLAFLNIFYCKNISIIKCNLRTLDLRNCSDIRVERVTSSWLKMVNCNDCSLFKVSPQESTIFYKCYNNIIEQCIFGNFFYNPGGLSRNNVLKDNKVFLNESGYKLMEAPIDPDLRPTYRIDCYANSKGAISSEVACSGKGTFDDPIIIDSLDSVPFKIKRLDLFHVREHLILRDIIVKKLRLYDVRNTLIENSSIKGLLLLKFCQNMKIMTTYAKTLQLGGCDNIEIQNSEFVKIKSIKELPSEFSLKNSSYKKMDKALLD